MKDKHFPIQMDPVIQEKRNQFNLALIKSVVSFRLPDISLTEMDLPLEFENLFGIVRDKIILFNPDNANLSHTEAKNRVLGFVKTLIGVPLLREEIKDWQMYKENKPALINALKHIVIVLNKEINSDHEELAYHNFAILVNGICNCPTGQAEGVNSVINTLIRHQNGLKFELAEQIGQHVFTSVAEASVQRGIGREGHVHAISRARIVLASEIGIDHTISGFKEKISKISDNDIPEVLQNFYQYFTLTQILEQTRKIIQTPKDFEVLYHHVPLELEAIKANKFKKAEILIKRPISVGTISAYLIDHGIKRGELVQDYGIPEDGSCIADLGIIRMLIKMGYIKENSPLVHRQMQILKDRILIEHQNREYMDSVAYDQQQSLKNEGQIVTDNMIRIEEESKKEKDEEYRLTSQQIRDQRLLMFDRKQTKDE